MKTIDSEKNNLKDFITTLNITKEEYEYIIPLLNVDDSLFTKIIEEVKNGNLKFNDFYRIFDDIPEYSNSISESIEAQEKLYNEYSLLFKKLSELNDETLISQMSNLAIIAKYTSEGKTIEVTDIEKQNILFSLFTEDISDPFKNYYKSLMLNDIMESIENGNNEAVGSMLLSLHDYLLPVDFKNIVLNDTDRKFMKENSIINDDEMKKIKAIAAYAAAKY